MPEQIGRPPILDGMVPVVKGVLADPEIAEAYEEAARRTGRPKAAMVREAVHVWAEQNLLADRAAV